MNLRCARCGQTLASATASCAQCAANAASGSTPRWGTLDIKRGELPLQRRSLAEAQPQNSQVAHNPHDDMRGVMTNSLPASEAQPAPAPARKNTPSPLPRPRAGSSPQHPALRGSSPQNPARPQTPTRKASAPLHSAPLHSAPLQPARKASSPQHPATRGSTPRQAPVRVATGAVVANAAAFNAQAATKLEPDVPGFDDRFGDVSAFELGPALEIEGQLPALAPEQEPEAPAPATPAPEAPEVSQAKLVAQLSGYGAPPQKLLQTVPYFFHVFMRKRQLMTQLTAQLQQRKRIEQKADDALCGVAEALYGQRNDPRLAGLAAPIRLVTQAREQITSNAVAGKRVAQTRKRELEELSQRALRIKQRAAPFEQTANDLAARIETGKARVRENEQQVRKLEAEQKTLRGSTQVAALEQIATLETQLEGLRGASQSLHVELLPLSEDLSRAKTQIAKHMDALARIEELQHKTSEAAERDSDRQRIATGSAASAYRETLRSLANAAIRAGLSELAAPAMANATAAEAPIADERHSEDLLRKALSSYDEAAYRRGRQMIAGSIIGTLLFFVLLIAF